MVVFTSIAFDAAYSPLELHEDPAESTVKSMSRRVSRSKTLDGGVELDDAGYSDGDRTIQVVVRRPTEAQFDAISGMIENAGTQRLSLADGVFSGALEDIQVRQGGRLSIRFLIGDKLSA